MVWRETEKHWINIRQWVKYVIIMMARDENTLRYIVTIGSKIENLYSFDAISEIPDLNDLPQLTHNLHPLPWFQITRPTIYYWIRM